MELMDKDIPPVGWHILYISLDIIPCTHRSLKVYISHPPNPNLLQTPSYCMNGWLGIVF